MADIRLNYLSHALEMQTNVTVYLPSFSFADTVRGGSDNKANRKLQTLWILHGENGDDVRVNAFTNLTRYADDNNVAVIVPCLNDFYNPMHPNTAGYLRYVAYELPALCRLLFPLSNDPSDHYLCGLDAGVALAATVMRHNASAQGNAVFGRMMGLFSTAVTDVFITTFERLKTIDAQTHSETTQIPLYAGGEFDQASLPEDFLCQIQRLDHSRAGWHFIESTLRSFLHNDLPLRRVAGKAHK